MNTSLSQDDAYIRNVEQLNALVDHIRLAGLNALNEYQKDKLLNLTTRQGMLITTVARLARQQGNGITLSALARELHMSPSATSHLVDTLEELNLLKRHADEEDRRNIRITLSAAGNTCAALAKQGMLKAISRLTAQLTPEENELRVRMIDKLYHTIYPQAQ